MKNRVVLNKTHQLLPPTKGCLLIAEPFATDIYFSRSVVLLLDAGVGGSMGLVLNKRVEVDLSRIFAKYGLPTMPVYRGGPVDEQRLFYLHDIPHVQGAIEVLEGVYVGGSLREIAECYKASSRQYRLKFFLGYAGWSGPQILDELSREAWVVTESNLDVLGDIDEMWGSALLALGDPYYKMWLNCPFDPQLN